MRVPLTMVEVWEELQTQDEEKTGQAGCASSARFWKTK